MLPAETSQAALVATTGVEPEIFVPPLPGSVVHRAADSERDKALGWQRWQSRLPAGLSRDNGPISVNLDFLDVTSGAHVNISGISGVATKTTYASFLLFSLFTSGVLGAQAANTKALVFNVKGEDLLFLDHPNRFLEAEDVDRYHLLHLPADRFPSVGTFAPPRRGDPNGTPEAERLVYRTLLRLAGEGRQVVVIAGNHAARRAELVVVDGPIRRREGVPNAVGHIKTHHHRYLPPALAPIIGELDAGERTPMFAIGAPFPRLSSYLRLPGPRQHPWSGVVRHEIAIDDEHEARRLADLAAALIPRFASRPARDPRAPQNLTPISGLESQLRHRLGDGLMLYRALRIALG